MKLTNPMKDALLGLTFVGAAAVIVLGVEAFPGAAAAFPRLIALSIFAVFGGLLILRAVIQWRAETEPGRREDDPTDMTVSFDGRTIAMSVAICAAFVGVRFIGFVESMALLAIVSCIAFRMKPLATVVYPVLLCAILIGFLTLMGVRLPAGPLSGPILTLLN